MLAALLTLNLSRLTRGVRVPHRGHQLRDGLRYARGVPEILAPLCMMALIGTFTYEFEVSLPLFARGPLAGGAATYSWLMGAFGLGSVLGGIYSTRHAQTGVPRMIRAAGLYMAAMLATALTDSLVAAVILLLLVGFASIIFLTTGNSTIQIAAAPAYRGRVTALWSTAFVGSTPIGATIIGAVGADSPRLALIVGGAAAGAAAIAGVATLARTGFALSRPLFAKEENWRVRVRVVAQLSALCLLSALVALPAFGATRARRPPTTPETGTVYIESNSRAPRSNAILAFHYANGVLSGRGVRRYPTGGSGSHDLRKSGVLDADQEIITNPQHTLLFAVNSSSDTIAVFHIHAGGALTPVTGSPFSSGGSAPSSLGLAGRTLIVANKAQDGVRNLTRTPANYTSFHVRADGTLGPEISSIDVPPGSSPLQAYVTPDRKVLISSEETGVFRAFRILPDGSLVQGPNSPLPMPRAVFPGGRRVPNVWPAGLASNPRHRLLYAELANVSRTIVYRWNDQARLTFVRAISNPGSYLPCWTRVNRAGTRMYTGNAGSDNMSVFDISRDPTDPPEIQSVPLDAPGDPWNFEIDPSGHVIFLLDMRATTAIPAGQGNDLHALRIGASGRLTEEPSSPVKIPVRVGTNPIGLTIVPDREG